MSKAKDSKTAKKARIEKEKPLARAKQKATNSKLKDKE